MRQELRKRLSALLTATSGFPSLGAERRENTLSVTELEREMDDVFDQARPAEPQRELIRSIVLLWHDHLDESHSISQNIHSVDGSYVHGIMHRREPDYGNAKYWFHRVGGHPIFFLLGKCAYAQTKIGHLSKLQYTKLMPAALKWDLCAFVDAVAAAPEDKALRTLQGFELTGLLDHALSK